MPAKTSWKACRCRTAVTAWMQAFVDKHHVDEPFYKRKRKRYDPGEVGFGRRTERAGRVKGNGSG